MNDEGPACLCDRSCEVPAARPPLCVNQPNHSWPTWITHKYVDKDVISHVDYHESRIAQNHWTSDPDFGSFSTGGHVTSSANISPVVHDTHSIDQVNRIMPQSILRAARQNASGAYRPRSIRWDNQMHLICYDAEQSFECTLEEHYGLQQCRALWHLHGQTCSAHYFFQVLQRWVLESPPTWILGNQLGGHLSVPMPCLFRTEPEVLHFKHLSYLTIHADYSWQSIEEVIHQHPTRRKFFVETWFLTPRYAETCVRSRRFAMDAFSTQVDFNRRCLQT